MLDAAAILTSLISLIVGSLAGAELTRFLYRPKVIVRYQKPNPLTQQDGTFWSLTIENRGRTVAKDCIAVISINFLDSKQILNPEDCLEREDLPSYRSENTDLETPRAQLVLRERYRSIERTSLCWSKLGNPEAVDINPGISQSLDLCKCQISDSKPYFIIPSEEGWRCVRVRIMAQKLEGSVLICPSNEFPTQVKFKIFINEDGSSSLLAKRPSIFSRIFRRGY